MQFSRPGEHVIHTAKCGIMHMRKKGIKRMHGAETCHTWRVGVAE